MIQYEYNFIEIGDIYENFLISTILAGLVVFAIISVIDVTWPIAGLIGAVVGGGNRKVLEIILKNKKTKEV